MSTRPCHAAGLNMSSVPLPWWTSKSMMAMRSRPCFSSAYAAATPILLKMQKPIDRAGVAWWPHGRTAQNAFWERPLITSSTADIPAPAARRAALKL